MAEEEAGVSRAPIDSTASGRTAKRRRERRVSGVSRIRRLRVHLSRSRARAGFLLSAVCILGYALVPKGSYQDPLRQFALVLGSVAAGAIFLPELSSDLWTLTSEQVRRLVPEARRKALIRAIIGAESADQVWNELVYSEVVAPLLEVGRQPWLAVRNMSYVIQIHLNQKSIVEGLGPVFNNVETVCSAERVLPPSPDGSYWVSVVRSSTALAAEFAESRCLNRELVVLGDLDGKEWAEAITELCSISVVIDGEVEAIAASTFDPAEPDVVRFQFRPDLADPLQRIPVRIAFDFPLAVTETEFPAMISGRYCYGATVISLKLYHGDRPLKLACYSHFARRLGLHRDRNSVTFNNGTMCQELSFSTGRDSFIWPGSGVVFSWHE